MYEINHNTGKGLNKNNVLSKGLNKNKSEIEFKFNFHAKASN